MDEETQQAPLEPPPVLESQPFTPQAYETPHNPLDQLIPTRNPKALLAYYLGVFSLVPCFTPVLGPAALILGIIGLGDIRRNPNLPGKAHAIVGIVLGGLTSLAAIVLVVIAFVYGRRS